VTLGGILCFTTRPASMARTFSPGIASEPNLTPEQRILVLAHELDRTRKHRTRELSVLRARYEAWVFGNAGHERRARQRTRGFPWSAARPRRELEKEMCRLIEAQWAGYLPRRCHAKYPLMDYSMTRQFLDDVSGRVGMVPMDRVAWVVRARSLPIHSIERGPVSGTFATDAWHTTTHAKGRCGRMVVQSEAQIPPRVRTATGVLVVHGRRRRIYRSRVSRCGWWPMRLACARR
jgi:hypothetical protein